MPIAESYYTLSLSLAKSSWSCLNTLPAAQSLFLLRPAPAQAPSSPPHHLSTAAGKKKANSQVKALACCKDPLHLTVEAGDHTPRASTTSTAQIHTPSGHQLRCMSCSKCNMRLVPLLGNQIGVSVQTYKTGFVLYFYLRSAGLAVLRARHACTCMHVWQTGATPAPCRPLGPRPATNPHHTQLAARAAQLRRQRLRRRVRAGVRPPPALAALALLSCSQQGGAVGRLHHRRRRRAVQPAAHTAVGH